VDKELRLALTWWKKVLAQNLVQCIGWSVTDTRPAVHLYTDARAVPPRVAAVLFACAFISHARVCFECFVFLLPQGR